MGEKFRTRWNVPQTVGTIDGKHISIKRLKKSGSAYYNFKGLFSLVLLALVDVEYIFLWTKCGSSGSCSDAQIFNRRQFEREDLGQHLGATST